jgi:transcription initiation factor IIE alpha subunit
MDNTKTKINSYSELLKESKYYVSYNTNLTFLLNPTEIVIFSTIVHLCNLNHTIASFPYLSKITNIKQTSLKKYMSNLKRLGLIDYVRCADGASNKYNLKLDNIKYVYDGLNTEKIDNKIAFVDKYKEEHLKEDVSNENNTQSDSELPQSDFDLPQSDSDRPKSECDLHIKKIVNNKNSNKENSLKEDSIKENAKAETNDTNSDKKRIIELYNEFKGSNTSLNKLEYIESVDKGELFPFIKHLLLKKLIDKDFYYKAVNRTTIKNNLESYQLLELNGKANYL